nr:MAG TPA: hypothetical protein [Caudoviricetes sp.]
MELNNKFDQWFFDSIDIINNVYTIPKPGRVYGHFIRVVTIP